MISRVASFTQNSAMLAASMKVQVKLAEVQAQEASGLKAETYGGLGGDTSRALNIDAQIARLEADTAAASTASTELETAYSTVGEVADLASSIRSQIAAMGDADEETVESFAQEMLDELASLLNTRSGGRYLFGGTATDAAPVDLEGYAPSGDVSDASYYDGAEQNRRFVSAGGRQIELGVTADDPAFEALFRGLTALRDDPASEDALNQAYDLAGEAVTGLGSIQESLSARVNALSSLTEYNEAAAATLENLKSELTGADLTEAAVKLVQYQTQLEALYSSISKLSSLSLSNFL